MLSLLLTVAEEEEQQLQEDEGRERSGWLLGRVEGVR